MSDRAAKIKNEIAALRSELASLAPASELSVRELARRAGISPSTAHRFKAGKVIDVPTAQKLIASKLMPACPCCGIVTQNPAHTFGKAALSVRRDGSIVLSFGDPRQGRHEQFDFEGSKELAEFIVSLVNAANVATGGDHAE